jgi:hypothetical protein
MSRVCGTDTLVCAVASQFQDADEKARGDACSEAPRNFFRALRYALWSTMRVALGRAVPAPKHRARCFEHRATCSGAPCDLRCAARLLFRSSAQVVPSTAPLARSTVRFALRRSVPAPKHRASCFEHLATCSGAPCDLRCAAWFLFRAPCDLRCAGRLLHRSTARVAASRAIPALSTAQVAASSTDPAPEHRANCAE